MQDQEFDRILLEQEIVPSSGFTASVMDAVRSEALAPKPIPFPWKRALPGLAAAGLTLMIVLAMSIAQLLRSGLDTPLPASWLTTFHSLQQSPLRIEIQWIILALLLSLACAKLPRFFLARRA